MNRWFLCLVAVSFVVVGCTSVDDQGRQVVSDDVAVDGVELDGAQDTAEADDIPVIPDEGSTDVAPGDVPPAPDVAVDDSVVASDVEDLEDTGEAPDAETQEEDTGPPVDVVEPEPDADGPADPSCGGAVFPFKGSLCGTPGNPCALDNGVMLAVAPGFTNGSPDIIVGSDGVPHVLHWRAVGSYTGHYWGPDGDDGTIAEELPMPVATGAIALAPDGTPNILVDDGTSTAPSLWHRTGGVWSLVSDPPEVGNIMVASAMAMDSGGCVHAALGGQSILGEGTSYGRHTQVGWELQAVGETGSSRALALGPDGIAHLAWWGTKGASWVLQWKRIGDETEEVMAIGSGLGESEIRMAVSGTDTEEPGTSWLFFGNPEDFQGTYPQGALLVASRPPLGGWSVNPVQLPHTPGGELCLEPAGSPGDCEADHWSFHPLGVVATDSPRFIYSGIHTTGDFTSSCTDGGGDGGGWFFGKQPPPPNGCEWIGEHATTSTWWVAAPDGPGYLSTEVGFAGASRRGSAAIGPDGRIHVVSYDDTTVGSGTGYVILGEVADKDPADEAEIPE